MFEHLPPIAAPLDSAAQEDLLAPLHWTAPLRGKNSSSMRILVYDRSAVGRDVLPRILRGFGADSRHHGPQQSLTPIDPRMLQRSVRMPWKNSTSPPEMGGKAVMSHRSTDGDYQPALVTAVLPLAL